MATGKNCDFHRSSAKDKAERRVLARLRGSNDECSLRDAVELIEEPGNNPEVAMQKTELGAILLRCLKQLSPAHREIIDLVHCHERSIDDVAKNHPAQASWKQQFMLY